MALSLLSLTEKLGKKTRNNFHLFYALSRFVYPGYVVVLFTFDFFFGLFVASLVRNRQW